MLEKGSDYSKLELFFYAADAAGAAVDSLFPQPLQGRTCTRNALELGYCCDCDTCVDISRLRRRAGMYVRTVQSTRFACALCALNSTTWGTWFVKVNSARSTPKAP